MSKSIPALALLLAGLGAPLWAVSPPCRPCAGLRVTDPGAAARELALPPLLEGEARLYLSWPVELTALPSPDAAAAVAATGATPWMRLEFRAAAPLTSHLDQLEGELAVAAEIARQAGPRAHFQILWEPADGAAPQPAADYAFLLKRTAAAIGGAQPGARIVTAPLPADESYLRELYDAEVAAYVDGVALAPAEPPALERALAVLTELDPGRPAVLDARPFPTEPFETLAAAAEDAARGLSVTFFDAGSTPTAEGLAPLKLLAREFQGDLSYDPYSKPEGVEGGWSFARGEDLSLRVLVRAPAGADELTVRFSDSLLGSPQRVMASDGRAVPLAAGRRSAEGYELRLADPDPVTLLRLERLTNVELEGVEGVEEKLTVTSEREVPVEEILRRLQAFEDAQKRRLDHYQAINTTHLRFQVGTGAGSVETTFRGPFFFRQGRGFDWAWDELLVNGVRWRGKSIPEIPLIQPEKAAAMPLEISFTKEYRYRLRGTGEVEGRDCWVVDFEPAVAVEPGRTLFRGTVWVDRQIYARVRTRAIQVGLEGDVLSNDETMTFAPLDAGGQPAAWSPESFFLPVRVVGQQLWSVLSATTVVERETLLDAVRINEPGFETARQAKLAGEGTMLRDTDRGMRYLVVDEETGQRVVQEEPDLSRRFLVGGVFQDDSQDYPIPLAGMNWLWLDWRGTGTQANIFFAGALATVAASDPSVAGSRFDLGFDAFALAIAGTDTVYRGGREAVEEDVKFRFPNLALKVGHPLGAYGKLELQYRVGYATYDRTRATAADFVVPRDTLSHAVGLTGRYNRSGYRLRLEGSYHLRSNWGPWGLPGGDDFHEGDDRYTRWGASVGKVWHLPKFKKLGAEVEYVDGSHLDRFSKYEFGFFSGVRVHGYQSDKVRAESAYATHLRYGFDLGEVLRLDLVGDAAWATDAATGLDRELLAGVGLSGTLVGPWSTVINLDVGTPVAGPDQGFSAFIAVLKLFD